MWTFSGTRNEVLQVLLTVADCHLSLSRFCEEPTLLRAREER